MNGVIDTRGVGRPDIFGGEERDWSHWKFRFEAWSTLLDFDQIGIDAHVAMDMLPRAERAPQRIEDDDMGPATRQVSRLLHGILVSQKRGARRTLRARLAEVLGWSFGGACI